MKEKKGMNAEELSKAVDDALIKRAKGEKLSKREELVIAYGHSAARCSCGVRR